MAVSNGAKTFPSNVIAASTLSEWNFKAKLSLLHAEKLSIANRYKEAGAAKLLINGRSCSLTHMHPIPSLCIF